MPADPSTRTLFGCFDYGASFGDVCEVGCRDVVDGGDLLEIDDEIGTVGGERDGACVFEAPHIRSPKLTGDDNANGERTLDRANARHDNGAGARITPAWLCRKRAPKRPKASKAARPRCRSVAT